MSCDRDDSSSHLGVPPACTAGRSVLSAHQDMRCGFLAALSLRTGSTPSPDRRSHCVTQAVCCRHCVCFSIYDCKCCCRCHVRLAERRLPKDHQPRVSKNRLVLRTQEVWFQKAVAAYICSSVDCRCALPYAQLLLRFGWQQFGLSRAACTACWCGHGASRRAFCIRIVNQCSLCVEATWSTTIRA
jgi:hypothetical protein